MGKILHKEPSRTSQICGYQMSIERMSSEFCGERKAPGLYFCQEHHDWMHSLYGRVRMAPGNVRGRDSK